MLFRFESKKKKKKKKKCKKSKHHSSFQWRWQEDSPQRIYRIYKYLSLSLSSHQISLLLQQIQTPKQNPSLDIQPSSHVFYSRLWSLLLDSCFIISWMSMSLSLFSLSFWTSFLRSYNLYNDVWIWDETKRKTIQRKNEENNLWRQQIVFLRKLFSELLLSSFWVMMMMSKMLLSFALFLLEADFGSVRVWEWNYLSLSALFFLFPSRLPCVLFSLLKTPPFDVSRDDVYRYIICFWGKERNSRGQRTRDKIRKRVWGRLLWQKQAETGWWQRSKIVSLLVLLFSNKQREIERDSRVKEDIEDKEQHPLISSSRVLRFKNRVSARPPFLSFFLFPRLLQPSLESSSSSHASLRFSRPRFSY